MTILNLLLKQKSSKQVDRISLRHPGNVTKITLQPHVDSTKIRFNIFDLWLKGFGFQFFHRLEVFDSAVTSMVASLARMCEENAYALTSMAAESE